MSASLRGRGVVPGMTISSRSRVAPVGGDHAGALGVIATISSSSISITRRVSPTNAVARRGEEHLAVPDADQQRAVASRADQEPRLLAVGDQERKMALQLLVGRPDGIDERPAVRAAHEMGDHLGVSLRRELLALGGELAADLAVVLDDAVEDDRDIVVVAGQERMRILLGDPPMRRPPRVADPGGRRRPCCPALALEVLELADGLDQLEAVRPPTGRSRPSRSPGIRAAQAR